KIFRNVAHVFGAHAGGIGLHDASSLLVLECLQLKHEIWCRLSLEYRRGFDLGKVALRSIAPRRCTTDDAQPTCWRQGCVRESRCLRCKFATLCLRVAP